MRSEKGQGQLLGIIVLAVMALGFFAFLGSLAQGDSNPQSSYVPQPGDCVVLPQGQDAVYDLFYAQQVNPNNCKAFVDQSYAHLLDAKANAVNAGVQNERAGLFFGIGAFGLVGFLVLCLGVAIVLKR